MRQVASVIKDGKVRYFIADVEEGELAEFATIAVPDSFNVEAAVKLGFNLISAVGLNGQRHPQSRHIITSGQARPELDPGRTWAGNGSVVAYVKAHPGCRVREIIDYFGASAKAVTSAVTRVARSREIERHDGDLYPRGGGGGALVSRRRPPERPTTRWEVTREQVIDYIRAHPGCGTVELATALLGQSTKQTKQVIGNRVLSIIAMARTSGGPTIVKRHVSNPRGVDLVEYRIEEEPDATAGVREPGLV
jgi:hypothetical protein